MPSDSDPQFYDATPPEPNDLGNSSFSWKLPNSQTTSVEPEPQPEEEPAAELKEEPEGEPESSNSFAAFFSDYYQHFKINDPTLSNQQLFDKIMYELHQNSNFPNAKSLIASGTIVPLYDDNSNLISLLHAEKELGRGSFGVAYLYKNLLPEGGLCVRKLIHKKHPANSEDELRREVELCNLCGIDASIGNIGEFYDIWMSYEGSNLENFLDNWFYDAREKLFRVNKKNFVEPAPEPEPEKVFLEVIEQAIKFLDHMNDQQVAHKDIKPSNTVILYDEKGIKLKFIDYGFAALHSDIQRLQKACGTPYYIAPEARVGKAQVNSDLYSLGIMIKEIYTCMLHSQVQAKLPEELMEQLKILYTELTTDEPNDRLDIKSAKQRMQGIKTSFEEDYFKTAYPVNSSDGNVAPKAAHDEPEFHNSSRSDLVFRPSPPDVVDSYNLHVTEDQAINQSTKKNTPPDTK